MSYCSSDQSMHTSSNAYPNCSEQSDPHMYDHSLTARTTESIISLLLRKNAERKRAHHQNFSQQFDPATSLNNSYYSECQTSTLSEDGRSAQVPTSLFSPNWDRSCLENHQAKRARVENILQRMAESPPMHFRDEKAVSHHASANAWNGSKGILPLLDYSQSRGETSCRDDYKTRESPKHPYVLHAKHQKDQMTQVYNLKNSEEECPRETALTVVTKREDEVRNTAHTLQTPDTPILNNSRGDFRHGLSSEWERNRNIHQTRSSNTGQDTDTELLDLLKFELSRAVNMSVDLVFKKMSHSLFKTSPQDPAESEHPFLEENMKLKEGTVPKYSLRSEITEPPLPNVQAEALSLVIHKPSYQDSTNTAAQISTSFSESNNPPSHSKQNNALMDQEVLRRFQDSSPNVLGSLPCRYNTSQSSVDTMSHSWEPIKVTSKAMSNCMSQQAQLVALSHLAFDNLCLPHIKRENQGIVDSSSFLPLNISFDKMLS